MTRRPRRRGGVFPAGWRHPECRRCAQPIHGGHLVRYDGVTGEVVHASCEDPDDTRDR